MTYYRASYLVVPVAAVAAENWIDIAFITVLTVLVAIFLDWREGRP